MKNFFRLFGPMRSIVLAALIMFSFAVCDSGSGTKNQDSGGTIDRQGGTYTGNRNNVAYTLVITPQEGKSVFVVGDSYKLTIKRGDVEKSSSGKVAELKGNAAVLRPSFKDAPAFNVTASDKGIRLLPRSGFHLHSLPRGAGRRIPLESRAGHCCP